MSNSKILFFLSGSIAAFKACQVISRLVQDGNDVQTVATASALKFIGPATLEGLTGKKVLSDIWEDGRAMDHIHLTRWADMAVLCPASATTLSRLSHGLADDLVSAMALAWPKAKPFHIFPAMNSQMLANPATAKNLASLREYGFTVHATDSGNLACGEEGAGRLLDPEKILARLAVKPIGKILLTAGATREPMDGVRFISNVSSGQTGATLATELQERGWSVDYLHGQGAQLPAHGTRMQFGTYKELDERLRECLGQNEYQAVIHCAAVSDYSVASINGEAADSDRKMPTGQELTLKLKANAKILPRLKEYSRNKNIRVIGFKLTLGVDERAQLAAAKQILSPSVDAIVSNDWAQVTSDRSRHPGHVLYLDQSLAFDSLEQLAAELHSYLQAEGEPHGSMS
jgi:phosphopantothenoylcysteine decarboxylase / phosphopantothenate---cysteine ligase